MSRQIEDAVRRRPHAASGSSAARSTAPLGDLGHRTKDGRRARDGDVGQLVGRIPCGVEVGDCDHDLDAGRQDLRAQDAILRLGDPLADATGGHVRLTLDEPEQDEPGLWISTPRAAAR